MIFAKALDKVDEIFKNDMVIKEIINKQELFKKLTNFFTKSIGKCFNLQTFKLLLTTFENYIDIRDESLRNGLSKEKKEEME